MDVVLGAEVRIRVPGIEWWLGFNQPVVSVVVVVRDELRLGALVVIGIEGA